MAFSVAIGSDRTFLLDGVSVSLQRVGEGDSVFRKSMRPNAVADQWHVDLVVSNATENVVFGPLILRWENVRNIEPGLIGAQRDADDAYFLNLTPLLNGDRLEPGAVLPRFTISLGNLSSRPEFDLVLYGRPPPENRPLVIVRTLSSEGIPLEGVPVVAVTDATPGPLGGTDSALLRGRAGLANAGNEGDPVAFSGRGGWTSLDPETVIQQGAQGWSWQLPGYFPVFRPLPDPSLDPVMESLSVRLTPWDGANGVDFDAQTMPVPVPMGWTPLLGFYATIDEHLLALPEPTPTGRVSVLARWNGIESVWESVETLSAGIQSLLLDGANPSGLHAVLVADPEPTAPPIPESGDPVLPWDRELLLDTVALSASGSVVPAVRAASTRPELVTATATVEIRSETQALPSGLVVPCEVTEIYRLRDGRVRVLPTYGMRLRGQKLPGSSGSGSGSPAGRLMARFPLRPLQLLDGEELIEARIRVSVLAPALFVGGILEDGEEEVTGTQVRIRSGAGEASGREAVLLLEPAALQDPGLVAAMTPAGLEWVTAFEWAAGNPGTGRRFEVSFEPQGQADRVYVLARAVFDQGLHGFQPVARWVSDGSGVLQLAEPEDGTGLPGVDGGGQFVLFRTAAPEAVVRGVARDAAGEPAGGLVARRGPWTAFSESDGRFSLLAPAGEAEVVLLDPASGDVGVVPVQVPASLADVSAEVSALGRVPRVVDISPANGSVGVSRVTPVVVRFSEPMDPGTLGGGNVRLLAEPDVEVEASLRLNAAGTVMTLLPVETLSGGQAYRLELGEGLTDRSGEPLEGARMFTFTTLTLSAERAAGGQITIYEPGAVNLTPELLARVPAYDPARDRDAVVVEGSPASAEPGNPVILVNESTGDTATVLAGVDGSFVGLIRGGISDFIAVELVNANGTRNQFPATRQRFDDGSVGLFGSGGIIRSSGEGTPVEFIVEPGAINGKTVFKVESMTSDTFESLVGGVLPEGAGRMLSAFTVTESGDPLNEPADVRVPVDLEDLGLPAGTPMEDVAFLVVMPMRLEDRVIYQVVDTASFESDGDPGSTRGHVRTASPPFVGMLTRALAGLAASARMTTITPVVVASTNENPHKGETAAFGILPIIARGPLQVGGFVRSVRRTADGVEELQPVGGATVRVLHPDDEANPDAVRLALDGELVSITDNRGNFGFFFRPSEATVQRALVATHPRYPFQKAMSAGFAGERQGVTVVRAELRFMDNLPDISEVSGAAPPVVSVRHAPALPSVGSGEDAGAVLTVTGVDDREVSPPTLRVVRVEDLRGEEVNFGSAQLSQLGGENDLPGRKVRQFRLTAEQAGRVILEAHVADDRRQERTARHAVSFGVNRPMVPPPEGEVAPLRVVFSWPPHEATHIPGLTPVHLRFNKPVSAALVESGQLDWLTFGQGHVVRRTEISSDRREIVLFYDGPVEGEVQLSVGPGIQAEDGAPFNQDSREETAAPFRLSFRQSESVRRDVAAQMGAGSVLLGRYAYALDRGGMRGTLKVFDLAEPTQPVELRSLQIGYPTAMALVPGYSMPGDGGECETGNWLALFTGNASEPKYLQLAQLEGGRVALGPRLILSGGGLDGQGRPSVAAEVTQVESLSQVVKAKWDPPYLGYFELGSDVTSIKLINLTSFQRVALANGVLSGFGGPVGDDGLDANGDGDFCDPDDQYPIPSSDPLLPPGLAFSTAPISVDARIEDFDFHAGLGLVVSIQRFLRGVEPPRFETLLAAADPDPLDQAFVRFEPGDSLRRVLLLPATTLETADGAITRDVAMVSVGRSPGDGHLAVIDVSVPSRPELMNRIPLPTGEGTPAAIQRRSDGLLAVATSQSVLLVDPSRLIQPAPEQGGHPAIVGRVDGTGTGVRDVVADASGINLTYGGANGRFVLGAPRFSFIRFNAVVDPRVIAEQPPATVEGFLRSASPVFAADVQFPGPGGQAPELDPTRHYYVLVDAPGGAGRANGRLPLALCAVDGAGMPQPERGGTVVPAVVGDKHLESALMARRVTEIALTVVNLKKAVGGVSEAQGLLSRAHSLWKTASNGRVLAARLSDLGRSMRLLPDGFQAVRLSNDPNHALYNRFLAGPFMILGGAPRIEDLMSLRQQAEVLELERVYLRPSSRLWVGLPSERETAGNLLITSLVSDLPSLLRPFISTLDMGREVRLLGMTVPYSRDVIEDVAAISAGTGVADITSNITTLVALLNNVPLVSLVLKSEWNPRLLPGAHALLHVNHRDRPLVLVPGFAASKLYINGKNQWLGLPGALQDRQRMDLQLTPDGEPVAATIATDMLRYTIEQPVEVASIYGDWVQYLTGQLGFNEYSLGGSVLGDGVRPEDVPERMRVGGKPDLGQSPVPNLFVFPYDWRTDNQLAAEKLRDYVRLVLEMHPDADGIDLVGHSNGGLVARAFMLLPGQRPLVRRFISVGTPWLGAPKPLVGLRTGNMDDTGLNVVAPIRATRNILQFSPGAHQLLPGRGYFELGYRPFVEDGYDVDGSGFANDQYDYDQYMNALARHFLREPVREFPMVVEGSRLELEALPGGEHPVRANAESFRVRGIEDHTGDDPNVEMHHIVGMGAVPDTIGQVRVRGRLVPVEPVNNAVLSVARVTLRETEQIRDGADLVILPEDGTLPVNPAAQFRLREEIEVRYVSGDGTVPIGSLARGYGSEVSLNAPHARVYPLLAGLGQDESGHNPMLNTRTFFSLFDDIYNQRPMEELDLAISVEGGFVEGRLGGLTVVGSPPPGVDGPVDYIVDFGDGGVELLRGGTFEQVRATHRYRRSGEYLVTVAATAGDRVRGLTSRRVVVANDPPTVRIEAGDLTVNRGATRVLTAVVSDSGLDERHTFEWEHPGGRSSGTGLFALPVTFDRPGTHTVSVRVVDLAGAEESDTVTFTVLPEAAGVAANTFGPDPASVRRRGAAQVASLPGFPNQGHPELMVRVSGMAPGDLDTVGVSAEQRLSDDSILGGVFEAITSATQLGLAGSIAIERVILPQVAKFLGLASEDVHFARLLRKLPREGPGGIDLSATRALVGALGDGRAIEVDMMYMEGSIPKVLRRWVVPSVPNGEGVLLEFDWIELEGVLKRVRPDLATGSPLRGSALEVIEPAFSTFAEQIASDRTGPVTLGVLNPALNEVTIVSRDNLTPADRLQHFVVFDANENGRLEDDIFYLMETNVVSFSRLPKRPFAVVGVDEQGNVGSLDPFRVEETRDFLGVTDPAGGPTRYEEKINAIRLAVRGAIQDAFNNDLLRDRFLLDKSHVWVFEQGSGANLWKPNYLARCNGVYLPGMSDNDYELFLPVHTGDEYTFTEADRLRFEASQPHRPETLEGDWYFRRPQGLDVLGVPTSDLPSVITWRYRVPDGIPGRGGEIMDVPRRDDDDDLSLGFFSPLTPAEMIARVFTHSVTRHPERRELLPETTFFPERREHFMFGRLHLQRPPAFGDDPIGDGGTGRQLLLLKWLVEGAFVTDDDSGLGSGFSPNAPLLAAIHDNWRRVGVPHAEGYEWGLFQDFAALKSRPFQSVELRLGTDPESARLRLLQRSIDDAVAQQKVSRIRKLGKAAIRAALARLAGDPDLNGIVVGVPPEVVALQSVRSFEELILDLILANEEALAVFGEFANDRDDRTEPPDLRDFVRAKNGERAYLATLLSEPGAYERYVRATFEFLRQMVQRPTLPAYEAYTEDLRDRGAMDELVQRADNLRQVIHGSGSELPGLLALNSDRRIARIDLPLAVEVYATESMGPVRVERRRSSVGGGGPASGRRGAALANDTIPDGEPITELDAEPNRDATVFSGDLILEGSGGESEVTQEMTLVGAAGDAVVDDDTKEVSATLITGDVPQPVIFGPPVVYLGIRPAGSESFFMLEDWPADAGRPRSPRYMLRKTDRLVIGVAGDAGVGGYQALVTTQSDPVARLVPLVPFEDTGIHDSDQIQFANVNNVLDDRLYVKDEELLRVEVSGPGLEQEQVIEVMIDLGEFASVTVQHADRPDDIKPRYDYEFTYVGSPAGFRWEEAGIIEFPDDVAAAAFAQGDPDGDNAMRRFLQAFGDPHHPETGEADVLYVHTHGGKNGLLVDHVNNSSPPGTRRLVLDPVQHLAANGLWNSDAEWFISEACSILNDAVDTTLTPIPGITAGRLQWTEVMRSSIVPLHGVLGFSFAKQASRPDSRVFLDRLNARQSYVDAWRSAWEDAVSPRPWAVLHYRSARNDSIREVSRDPLPSDPIVYHNYLGDYIEEECDSADPGENPTGLAEIGPGLWAEPGVLATVDLPHVPRGATAGARRFLKPGSDLLRWYTTDSGVESLKAPARQWLAVGGATNALQARRVAESFLASRMAVGLSGLRWRHTGETIRQVSVGNIDLPAEVTSRVVHFDVVFEGLPLADAGVSVQVDSVGISKVVAAGGFALGGTELGQEEKVRPMLVAEALVHAAKPLVDLEPGGVLVRDARLCWRRAGVDRWVPAWEFRFASVSPQGVPGDMSRRMWLDALTGELVEVSR